MTLINTAKSIIRKWYKKPFASNNRLINYFSGNKSRIIKNTVIKYINNIIQLRDPDHFPWKQSKNVQCTVYRTLIDNN